MSGDAESTYIMLGVAFALMGVAFLLIIFPLVLRLVVWMVWKSRNNK